MRSQRIDRSQFAEALPPSSAQTAPEKSGSKGFASVFGEQARGILAASHRPVHDEEISSAAQDSERFRRYSKEAPGAKELAAQSAEPVRHDEGSAVVEDASLNHPALTVAGVPTADAGEIVDAQGTASGVPERMKSGHAHGATKQERVPVEHHHRESNASVNGVPGKDGSATVHQASEDASVVANTSSGQMCALLPSGAVDIVPGSVSSDAAAHGLMADRGAISTASQRSEPKGVSAGKTDAKEVSSSSADASAAANDAPSATGVKESKIEITVAPQTAAPAVSMGNEMAAHGVLPVGLMQNGTPVVTHLGENRHAAEAHEAGVLTGHATADAAHEAALQPMLLGSNANSLEVGVGGGSHGWLKIRAELTGNGEVSASLTGGATAAERLRDDLPALHSYLEAEKVQVAMLQVHAASATTIAPQPGAYERSGFGGAADMTGNAQREMGGGQRQQERRGIADVPSIDGALAGAAEERQDAAFALRQVTGGGWLSVRA